MDELFGKKKSSALPKHDSPKELSECMANFFHDKIEAIHEELASLQDGSIPVEPDEEFSGETLFTDFSPVSQDEVEKIIKG